MPRTARRQRACLSALQSLLDAVRDAAVVIAPDGATIIAANRAAGELSGCAAGDLAGHVLAARWADHGEAFARATGGASAGSATHSTYDATWLRADGAGVAVECSAAGVDWAGGPATLLTLRTRSPQAHAETALPRRPRQPAEDKRDTLLAREEEAPAEAEVNTARFHALADAMPQIVWTANPDGWLDYYNQRWFDYTGMTLAQTEGWGWQPVLHPDDVQRCLDVWRAAVASGEPYEIEYRFKRASDGAYRWHLGRALPLRDALGQIVKWFGTCTDIDDQKRLADELRASRDQLRALFAGVHDAIVMRDARGRIVLANAAVAQLYGWASLDEFLARPVREQLSRMLVLDEHGAPLSDERNPTQLALRGVATPDTLVRLRNRDTGDDRVVLARSAPVRSDTGEVAYVVSTLHDVTEVKRAEEQARAARDELDAILRGITDGILVQTLSGELLYVNAMAAQIMGYASQEALRASPLETRLQRMQLFDEHGAPFPPAQLPNRRIWRGETYAEALVRGRGVFGLERWVMIKAVPLRDGTGAVTAVITVMSDVSERRKAMEELRRSRDELAAILRGIADGLYVQTMAGEMLYANQAAASMLGFDTAEELIASPLASRNDRIQILDERGEPFPLDALPNRRIWRGEAYAEALVRARYRDGSERWGIVKAVPLRDGAGAPNAVIVVLNDITERRRADELQRQAENLSRSNTALQEFAYVASHDLQEPLRMVASYTQLLQRRYRGKLDRDADEFIGYAVDGAQRMKQLISDLLAYSRVETQGQPPAPVDCDAVLADVLENLRVSLEEAAAEVMVAPLPVIAGDRTQIGQLLQNLLGNAIKFRGRRPPRISVTARRQADRWLIAVEDNGIGVPPQFAERIFGAFQRLHTREEYEGSGIGLAVCKKIVERHGGRIWVEPAAEGGARFCVTLPALVAAA